MTERHLNSIRRSNRRLERSFSIRRAAFAFAFVVLGLCLNVIAYRVEIGLWGYGAIEYLSPVVLAAAVACGVCALNNHEKLVRVRRLHRSQEIALMAAMRRDSLTA